MDRCVMRGWCGGGGNLVPLRDIDKGHDRERGERWTAVIMRGCGGEGVVTWCSHVTLTKFTTERGERDMDRCVMRGWCGRGRQLGAITRDIDKVHDRVRGREMDP